MNLLCIHSNVAMFLVDTTTGEMSQTEQDDSFPHYVTIPRKLPQESFSDDSESCTIALEAHLVLYSNDVERRQPHHDNRMNERHRLALEDAVLATFGTGRGYPRDQGGE